MNPALGARCFLMISFAARMTTFTYDGVTTATPLAVMEQGKSVDVMKSFLGFVPGLLLNIPCIKPCVKLFQKLCALIKISLII